MATEAVATGARRPQPWLLILLGLLGLVLLWSMFSGDTVSPAVRTTAPPAQTAKPGEQVQPTDLDVRIESLNGAPAPLDDGGRNPFRFQPRAQAAPPPSAGFNPGSDRPVSSVPPPPPVDPGPPAIGTLIKFIGIVDTGQEKIGAFSDCKNTFSGREGQVMEGRYRLVSMGVESAVVEYVDGKGRTRLPLNGQACVGK